MPRLHRQQWGRLSPTISVLSEQLWPHQARPCKLPKRFGNYSCWQHHALGGGITGPSPPRLHRLLGTSLVCPTAFLHARKPLTQLVPEQLRAHQGERLLPEEMQWGKKMHLGKRWPHGHSDVALHLEPSSPACPTHLTPGCNPGTSAGTHISLPSSACQSTAVLALALGRDPKMLWGLAGAPSLTGSHRAASQAVALSLAVCKQAGGDGSMC